MQGLHTRYNESIPCDRLWVWRQSGLLPWEAFQESIRNICTFFANRPNCVSETLVMKLEKRMKLMTNSFWMGAIPLTILSCRGCSLSLGFSLLCLHVTCLPVGYLLARQCILDEHWKILLHIWCCCKAKMRLSSFCNLASHNSVPRPSCIMRNICRK